MEYKLYIYNYSVSNYLKGIAIKTIINQLCKIFRKIAPELNREILTDYVYKSIYDYVMKEKQKVGVKNACKN